MIGYKNEYFEVIEKAGRRKNRQLLWKCKCKCGNISTLDTTQIKKVLIKSCGCSRKGNNKGNKFGFKHGFSRDPIYQVRNKIMNRCYNSKDRDYKYYEGRGIKVCDEWIQSPLSFIKWAIENKWAPGLTIDRIDPNGDYTPDNCQFLTLNENLKKMHRQKNRIKPPLIESKIKICHYCKQEINHGKA